MLVHIGECLGDDVVRGGFDLLREPAIGQGFELDRDGRAQGERLERGAEPPLGEHSGMQSARELADLLKSGGELVDRGVEEGSGVHGRLAEPAEAQ